MRIPENIPFKVTIYKLPIPCSSNYNLICKNPQKAGKRKREVEEPAFIYCLCIELKRGKMPPQNTIVTFKQIINNGNEFI